MLKLRYGHADPRDAGVGNIVNCGAAMYIAPVGIANAGDPDGAYLEALDLTAGAPVELRPRGGRRARGGGRRGDAAGRDARVRGRGRRSGSPRTGRERRSRRSRRPRPALDGWRDGGLATLRAAIAPFDSVGEHYARPAQNARIPSRLHAIEEVPVALGLLVATRRRLHRDDARRRQLRPRLRLDRVDGRRARRRARVAGAARAGSRRSARRAGSTSRSPAARWPRWPRRSSPRTARASRRGRAALRATGGARLRVTWIQPEDLVGHELRQAREEGKDVDAVEERLARRRRPAGAGPRRLAGGLRRRELRAARARAARRARRAAAPARGRRARRARRDPRAPTRRRGSRDLDRIRGAWLGRAAGCVLGKPVENIPREGIRAIAQGTGNWPVRGWFTAEGLDPAVTERYPWNKA